MTRIASRLNPLLGEVTRAFPPGTPTEPPRDGYAFVDCHFLVVAVDTAAAERRKEEVVGILDAWEPTIELLDPRYANYLVIGGRLESQEYAFRLFALGQVLGFWTVVTPENVGITGAKADEVAGRGGILITGYQSSTTRWALQILNTFETVSPDRTFGTGELRERADLSLDHLEKGLNKLLGQHLVTCKDARWGLTALGHEILLRRAAARARAAEETP